MSESQHLADSAEIEDTDDESQAPGESSTGESDSSQPFSALRPQHAEFARRFYECGDISRAYRAVYLSCSSKKGGLARGRLVLNRPEVAEYLSVLRKQALVPQGDSMDRANGDRLAWKAEVRHMAFATPGGRGRISHRDKREALKLYGELNDWFPKGITPTGIRAVFNIRIGGKQVMPGGLGRVIEQLPADVLDGGQIEALAPATTAAPEPAPTSNEQGERPRRSVRFVE